MSKQLIHVLAPHVANQIAAGEVVERPASAVKELMENSVDAGATRIDVRIVGAGKKRIEIEDNGCGMSPSDAELSLQRHATSKIESSEDLHHIASHGFRGEALPSIASVSRFRMVTCFRGETEAVEIRMSGGMETDIRPAPTRVGTRIEIQDLFLNTPARLNFMRSDKTEEAAIVDAFKALALAHPKIEMSLSFDGRQRYHFTAQEEESRIHTIMGSDFAGNSTFQHLAHEGIEVFAYLGLPTFHHRDSGKMSFLVNGRVIRDKQLIAALRAGYRDVMFHDRYPVAVVRIEMNPELVDVNVHPAKREVRFKSPQAVFAAIAGAVREAISRMGQSVASTTTHQALHAMGRSNVGAYSGVYSGNHGGSSGTLSSNRVAHSTMPRFQSEFGSRQRSVPADIQRTLFQGGEVAESGSDYQVEFTPKLGEPLAQIHSCYLLAQTDDGVILIDQHAAHERMTYEKLKTQLTGGNIRAQLLLTPEPLELDGESMAWVEEHGDELKRFGVELETAGDSHVHIRTVPAMLSQEPPIELAAELIESCMLLGADGEADATGLGRVLERWLGNRACKGSIKAGRALSREEQQSLLREMEKTPNIAQCNHGRPTYVKLSLNELDRLFGRKD